MKEFKDYFSKSEIVLWSSSVMVIIISLCAFLHRVQQFLFKAVNRRGCRRAYTWGGFWEMLKCYPLAKPKTYYCLY